MGASCARAEAADSFPVMRTPVLVVVALAAGCSKPAPPTLTPERASVTQVNPQGIELRLELAATNPNSVDLSAREIHAHVVVDKKYDLGTVTLPKSLTLPAGKTTNLDVPLSAKWMDVGSLVQLAATQAAVPYSVDGTLSMGGDLVSVSVPFHLEGSVTHDQIVGGAINSLPPLPGFLK
jgi:LEA14-like dessication related protein